jgi:hypothetical protein
MGDTPISRSTRHRMAWLTRLMPVWVAFILCDEALACAVCFGDPDSDLAKGAVAGVVLLGCVIFCVLLGIAGTAVHWSRKARRLELIQDESPPDRESDSVDPR